MKKSCRSIEGDFEGRRGCYLSQDDKGLMTVNVKITGLAPGPHGIHFVTRVRRYYEWVYLTGWIYFGSGGGNNSRYLGGHELSLSTGNAGGRLACGTLTLMTFIISSYFI
ncbi:hypothetical protein GIB67_041161 [Kingdonia uniflora]|uniref:Superoxide dismutase n=1 Tax=Kingdonia uniflora TaxID=39325 RepID=A0A7J7LKD8_9MAGN|nr:hypothetical protein GIB67_041161 [Kingdonia uniflora]